MLYIVFIVVVSLVHHYTVLSYVHIGSRFARHIHNGTPGYDGQFYYQLARDPWHAYQFLDKPAYRYQRIIYPLVVRLLSFGQEALIPYMLLLVNFVSIVFSVEIVARLLAKRGLSPWFSLALGLYFGQAAAFIFDTAEPFTYALICLGLWLIEKEYLTAAALAMGLAALSRETAIFFPLGYTLYYFLHKRWQDFTRFVVLALLPLPIWYGILWLIFGKMGVTGAPPFERLPFGGLFIFFNSQQLFWSLVIFMLIPILCGWAFAISEMWRQRWSSLWAGIMLILLLHLALVTFMAADSYHEYVSAGRISTGLVLAILLYGWRTRNIPLLRAAQFYAATFPIYAVAIVLTVFART